MKCDKYGYYKTNDKNAEKQWFYHCQENSIPYVTVIYRSSFADVEWDYITYPMSIDGVLRKNKQLIEDNADKIFNKYAEDKSTISCRNECVIKFNNISIDNAKKAASELYDLIANVIDLGRDK